MKYEKPEIVCVNDAARSIQQMQKDVIAADHSNGTNLPPAFPAEEYVNAGVVPGQSRPGI